MSENFESDKRKKEDLEGEYICPLTRDFMTDPVKFKGEKHAFERKAIEAWFAKHDKNPLSDEMVSDKNLTADPDLKRKIEAYKAQKVNIPLKFDSEDMRSTRRILFEGIKKMINSTERVMPGETKLLEDLEALDRKVTMDTLPQMEGNVKNQKIFLNLLREYNQLSTKFDNTIKNYSKEASLLFSPHAKGQPPGKEPIAKSTPPGGPPLLDEQKLDKDNTPKLKK